MRRLVLYIYMVLVSLSVWAQTVDDDDPNRIYEDAESAYNIGRVEQVQELLGNRVAYFKGTLKQSAYRLLALANMELDKEYEAEQYVRSLLRENPYYSTVPDDPQRFVDLVEDIKGGMGATITTASSKAENLNESPVPVTLITEEMIRNSGARNLKEVLMAYVPGMLNVDCNDDINMAMRSMYSSGQEKMLFMLNGHRLNSYGTNVAAPDFSLSLEKVKQIEVLRGPASSLYGGVALSAVVNIITKQGADMDGFKMKAGLGSYGQFRGDLLFGKRYFDLDVLAWGSMYKAKGEKYYIPKVYSGTGWEGDITVGGVGNKPSYDFGMTLSWNGFSFMYDTHFSHIRSPYSLSYTFAPYEYEDYVTYRGMLPGFSTKSDHANLSYTKNWGNMSLSASAIYDASDMMRYNVVTEIPIDALSEVLGTPEYLDSMMLNIPGIYRYIETQEKNYGLRLNGDYSYQLGKSHNGLLSFGMDFNIFEMNDSKLNLGGYHTITLLDENLKDIAKGSEHSYDAFVQLKHTWKDFIFNAGLRYDFKKRYNDQKVHEISPRVALIFIKPKWNAKLSYSKSFVDAPYFYRKSNVMLKESDDLDSEILHSLQLTVQAVNPLPGLTVELNGFYNVADQLIYPRGWMYANAGTGKSIGAELSMEYKTTRFKANLAMEALKILDAEYFDRKIDHMYNVPSISGSAVLAWQPLKGLTVHTHIAAIGTQTTYYTDYSTMLLSEERIDGRAVVDLGFDYNIGPVEFTFNVSNLFNKKYRQGGLGTGMVEQQSRWCLGTVAYKF